MYAKTRRLRSFAQKRAQDDKLLIVGVMLAVETTERTTKSGCATDIRAPETPFGMTGTAEERLLGGEVQAAGASTAEASEEMIRRRDIFGDLRL